MCRRSLYFHFSNLEKRYNHKCNSIDRLPKVEGLLSCLTDWNFGYVGEVIQLESLDKSLFSSFFGGEINSEKEYLIFLKKICSLVRMDKC